MTLDSDIESSSSSSGRLEFEDLNTEKVIALLIVVGFAVFFIIEFLSSYSAF